MAVTTALCVALQPPLAFALPEACGTVAAGQAAIASQAGHMDVTQASARAVIDWLSFNVGSSESVTFHQPGSARCWSLVDSMPAAATGPEGASNCWASVWAFSPVPSS